MHDVLCHAFTFLDYSHVRRLCLVCKEWNMIASSNRLWEFYFHLLSNNRSGKTNVPTNAIKDRRFWKNKIRDHFSTYKCRTSKRISPRYNLSYLKRSFPDNFSSQVVKMILSRLYLDSLWVIFNFNQPCTLVTDEMEDEFGYYHYKMSLYISGIEGNVIMRWYGFMSEFFLFGYNYSENYYLYFAKESDDQLNEEEFKLNNSINFGNLEKSNRSFFFKFNGRRQKGTVHGKEYLTREILDFLVPTVKSFKMSPIEFIPYWCLLFEVLMYPVSIEGDYIMHKEFSKHYPNLISNPLAYKFLAAHYDSKAERASGYIWNRFLQFQPKNAADEEILRLIKANDADSINLNTKDKESLMMSILTLFNNICIGLTSKIIPYEPLLSPNDEKLEYLNKARYMARIYNMCTKFTDEFVDYHLGTNFRNPFQVEE